MTMNFNRKTCMRLLPAPFFAAVPRSEASFGGSFRRSTG